MLDRQAKIHSYLVFNGDLIHWDPIFKRNLSKGIEGDLFSLLDVLSQCPMSGMVLDSSLWTLGVFSMASLLCHICFSSLEVESSS